MMRLLVVAMGKQKMHIGGTTPLQTIHTKTK